MKFNLGYDINEIIKEEEQKSKENKTKAELQIEQRLS